MFIFENDKNKKLIPHIVRIMGMLITENRKTGIPKGGAGKQHHPNDGGMREGTQHHPHCSVEQGPDFGQLGSISSMLLCGRFSSDAPNVIFECISQDLALSVHEQENAWNWLDENQSALLTRWID